MCSRRRKAPSVPASLQRSASASNRRFSLPENWRRLAIATTSGSRRAPSPEAISPVALPAPSATASEEEPDNPFREDFTNEVMFMSYLYSKLPETGVSPHIGTGGARQRLSSPMEGTDHFSLRPQANAAFADPRYHGRQGCRTKAVALANSLAGWSDRNYRRPSPAKPRRGNPLSRHVRCKNPHHGGKIRRQRDPRAAQGRGAGKLNRQTVHRQHHTLDPLQASHPQSIASRRNAHCQPGS